MEVTRDLNLNGLVLILGVVEERFQCLFSFHFDSPSVYGGDHIHLLIQSSNFSIAQKLLIPGIFS